VALSKYGLVLLGVGALGPSIAFSAQYTVTDLGGLGGASWATGINDAGQVVGYAWVSPGYTHGFLFTSGVLADLTPGLVGNSKAMAINSTGAIAGAYMNNWQWQASTWQSPGAPQNLGTLGGYESFANGINDSGQVVGWSETVLGSYATNAFVFSTSTNMKDLGNFGGGDGVAQLVNNSGLVLSLRDVASNTAHVYVTDSRTGITTDMGPYGANGRVAYNNRGQIGFSDEILTPGGSPVGIGTLGGWVNIDSINDLGIAVGESISEPSGQDHAFIYSNGHIQDLMTMIPTNSNWSLTEATGINNHGQIVGFGVNPQNAVHAFLLTPTPEPGTIGALFVVSTFGILRRRPQPVSSRAARQRRTDET
jgi:probable HAF family extracellular repeat protein